MNDASATPEERYADLVAMLAGDADVEFGSPAGKGFGSSALKVKGRIFAMLHEGRLVVKLPRQRVDALIASGDGKRFDPGHGRLMKEWLSLAPTSGVDWLSLGREAKAFVGLKE